MRLLCWEAGESENGSGSGQCGYTVVVSHVSRFPEFRARSRRSRSHSEAHQIFHYLNSKSETLSANRGGSNAGLKAVCWLTSG
jgi:hypothetical protein